MGRCWSSQAAHRTCTCMGPRKSTGVQAGSHGPPAPPASPSQRSAPGGGRQGRRLREGDPGGAGPTRGLWLTHVRSTFQ